MQNCTVPRSAFIVLLAFASTGAAAQDTTACSRPAPRTLTLTRPFLPSRDTVTLLAGELVANAADGRGSLTVEYLTRAAPRDTAGLTREATLLARAITPYPGTRPFAVLTVRACQPAPGGRTPAVAATFTVARDAGGAWQLAPP